MLEFLSDAWLEALDAAVRAARPVPDVAPFVIEQVVHDSAAGTERAYHLVFGDRDIRVVAGPASSADVTFSTDRETAECLARGETNAQQALAAGRFRVHGNIERLTRRAAGLRALDDAFAAVRAETTYR
ncbi:MAG: SCP2 sterol-binding domain-containing protein [Acidimicrobiia bacterium]